MLPSAAYVSARAVQSYAAQYGMPQLQTAFGMYHQAGPAIESIYSRSNIATPSVHQASIYSGEKTMSSLGRPLKVAHVNAALIPAGIENWLAGLCKYADPAKLQFIRTVVLTDWVDHRQAKRLGMPIEVGGRESVIAAAKECDVLLISDPGVHSKLVAEWIQEAKPIVTIFVAHGDGHYTASRMGGIGPAVDHVIAVTDHVRKTVCKGWPVSVILNGVDPQRLVRTKPRQQCRSEVGFIGQDFVVGFVGRFSDEKNPQLILDAVASLPPNVKVLFVGHGHLRAQLIEHAIQKLPGRFSFIDDRDHLGDLYAAMDTLVMPSALEGYGLVAMEAMLCGVPVIATNYGMIADLVHDAVHGLIVQPTADSIAQAIHKLQMSPSLRRSLANHGHQLAEQSGYASTMARQYEELLQKLWLQQRAASAFGAS